MKQRRETTDDASGHEDAHDNMISILLVLEATKRVYKHQTLWGESLETSFRHFVLHNEPV